ncbi:response regulator [Pseudomonas sp. F1_0610]|uniref:response regulator n=1 Tax=Pseudomonas sp. F1_0610 TaxID=3114284 RepID=UPI0039C36D9C
MSGTRIAIFNIICFLICALYLLWLTPDSASFFVDNSHLNQQASPFVFTPPPPVLSGIFLGIFIFLMLNCITRFIQLGNRIYIWLGSSLFLYTLAALELLEITKIHSATNEVGWYFIQFVFLLISIIFQLFALDLFGKRFTLNNTQGLHFSLITLSCLSAFVLLLNDSPITSSLVYFIFSSAMLTPSVIIYRTYQTHGHLSARFIGIGIFFYALPLILIWPLLINPSPVQLYYATLLNLIVPPIGVYILGIGLTRYELDKIIRTVTQSPSAPNYNTNTQEVELLLERLSQEIRVPLSGVMGMLGLIVATPLSAKQREYIQTMQRSCTELLNSVNEVIDISELKYSRLTISNTQFELSGLLEECIELFRPQIQEQHIELISFVQPQVPHLIYSDPSRLRQVLLTLMMIAYQHAQEKEIIFAVTVEQNQEPPILNISLESIAEPITALENQLLLQPVSNKPLHQFPPEHLRLIICNHLIQQLEGLLSYNINEHGQATLSLTLPLTQYELTSNQQQPLHLLQGKSLLIIDPSEVCRTVLRQQCEEWGIEVTCASSAQDALALLRSKSLMQQSFQVVLITRELPQINGIDLAVRIKQDQLLTEDSVLLLLTSTGVDTISTRNAGISQVLIKPVSSYTLKAALTQAYQHNSIKPLFKQQESLPEAKVLIAEDNGVSIKVVSALLNKLQIAFDVVMNGEQAYEAMLKRNYDLVLMDCEMPVLSGFEATKKWRQHEAGSGKRMPIIALTAYVFDEHRQQALDAGMDGHLSKPLNLSELKQLILRYTSKNT